MDNKSKLFLILISILFARFQTKVSFLDLQGSPESDLTKYRLLSTQTTLIKSTSESQILRDTEVFRTLVTFRLGRKSLISMVRFIT